MTYWLCVRCKKNKKDKKLVSVNRFAICGKFTRALVTHQIFYLHAFRFYRNSVSVYLFSYVFSQNLFLEFPIYLKLFLQNKKSNDQRKFQLIISFLLWTKEKNLKTSEFNDFWFNRALYPNVFLTILNFLLALCALQEKQERQKKLWASMSIDLQYVESLHAPYLRISFFLFRGKY
jgi:hypothetical protein